MCWYVFAVLCCVYAVLVNVVDLGSWYQTTERTTHGHWLLGAVMGHWIDHRHQACQPPGRGRRCLGDGPINISKYWYHTTLCLRKKRANFERGYLEIIRINFDDIWQKYSKYSGIHFACFSFHVGLLFFINFSSFKPDIDNNTNFENYASHCLTTWRHSVKKTKFWSNVCMSVKVTSLVVYNKVSW